MLRNKKLFYDSNVAKDELELMDTIKSVYETDFSCPIEHPENYLSSKPVISKNQHILNEFETYNTKAFPSAIESPDIFHENKPVKNEITEEDLYENNGGSTLVIEVQNKLIIASDTRLSASRNIYTRNSSKIYQVTPKMFLTCAGFQADGYDVYLSLLYEIKKYEKEMKIESAAKVLHHILYQHRFFPRYSNCCLAGYDGEGKAVIFSYDVVGSYQQTRCRVEGTGKELLQPLLESWVHGKNFSNFRGCIFDTDIE